MFMKIYNIIVLVFGLISFLLLILLYFVNRILQHKVKINNAFSSVKFLLDRKSKIIDTMLDFLTKNYPEEKTLAKTLKDAKSNLEGIKNNKEGIITIKKIDKDLLKFNNLENTYKVLSKNKAFITIKNSLARNKEELVYALDSYDVEVIKYNNYKGHKLIKVLSKILLIPEYSCYNKLK